MEGCQILLTDKEYVLEYRVISLETEVLEYTPCEIYYTSRSFT